MNEKYKLSKANLPEEIAEIHLGFSSLKYFIGYADISECTELDISFKDNVWTVRAVSARDGKEYIKRYKRSSKCAPLLTAISETEESATNSAADLN